MRCFWNRRIAAWRCAAAAYPGVRRLAAPFDKNGSCHELERPGTRSAGQPGAWAPHFAPSCDTDAGSAQHARAVQTRARARVSGPVFFTSATLVQRASDGTPFAYCANVAMSGGW